MFKFNYSKYNPRGIIFGGEERGGGCWYTEGVFRFKSWFPNAPGLIHGGDYYWNFTVLQMASTIFGNGIDCYKWHRPLREGKLASTMKMTMMMMMMMIAIESHHKLTYTGTRHREILFGILVMKGLALLALSTKCVVWAVKANTATGLIGRKVHRFVKPTLGRVPIAVTLWRGETEVIVIVFVFFKVSKSCVSWVDQTNAITGY